MLGWGCGEGERQRLAGLLPILLRHDAGLMLLLFEMAGAAAGEVEEQAGAHTLGWPRAISGRGDSAGEPAARRGPAHPPAGHRRPDTGILAPRSWRSRVGAREVGSRRGGPLLCRLPPPQPSRLFLLLFVRWGKHSRVPGRDACYLGRAGTRACASPCPAVGLRVSGPRCRGTGMWQGLPLSSLL